MKMAFILLLVVFACGFSDSSRKTVVKQIIGDTTIITDYGYKKVFTKYRDGKKNGNEISILSNGDTMEIAQYKNGKYDGRIVTFYERNKIATIRYFKDDNKVGEWLRFDTLGNLTVKTMFDKSFGRTDPIWSGKEVYFETNKPIFTQVWTKGRRSNVIVHDTLLYKRFQAKDISLGNKLFNEECAACHTIKRDLVGPALLESIKTRKQEWLIKFIRDGDSLYRAGDRDAKSAYEKYNNIKHPNFTYLANADVEAILKYIQEKK